MEKKEQILYEAIERFNYVHFQEIKAVCELVEIGLLYGLYTGLYKNGITDETLWETADDITRNAIGIVEAFSGNRFTDAQYYMLEGIVHDRAYKYLERHGVTIC